MYTASFCKLYEPVQLFCGQWKYLPIRPQESDVGSILLLPPLPPPPSPPVPRFPFTAYQMVSVCKNSKTEIFRNPHLFHLHVTKT